MLTFNKFLAIVIAISTFLSVFYIILIIFDIRLPYVTPPDKDEPHYVGLSMGSDAKGPRNFIEIGVTLHVNGTLVIGKPVLLEGVARLNDRSVMNVSRIDLGFQGGYCYPKNKVGPGILRDNCGLSLIRENGTNNLRGYGGMIYWEDQGDFPLMFAIQYYNGAVYKDTILDRTVHVEPRTTLDTERINKIQLALTIAATPPIFFGAVNVTRKFWKSNSHSNLSNNKPTNASNNPDEDIKNKEKSNSGNDE